MRPGRAAALGALVFLGWLVVGLFVFRGVVFAEGVVAEGDLGSPLDESLTLQYHAGTWNPWGQGFSIHPPKLVLVAPMTALTFLGIEDETAAKLYLPVILAIAGTSGSLTLLAILRDRPPAARWAGALVGGAALALDPWALSRLMAHYWLVLGYALWPPTVYLYWRALEDGARPLRLAALAALLAVQGVQLHLVFQTALLMAFVGLFHLATAPRPRDWRRFLRVTGLTVLMFVGFSAYWLVPFAAAALSLGTAPSYAVTQDVVSLLSRNQHPSWVLAGYGSFVPDVPYDGGAGWTTAWLGVALALVVVALGAALAYRRDRFVAMLLALGVLGLLAALGSLVAHPEAYRALVFSSSFGWLFRDPSKLTAVPRMCVALLLGLSVAALVAGSRRRLAGIDAPQAAHVASASPALLVVGMLLLANWPATTGDLNGALDTGIVPDDYDDLLDHLAALGPGHRALFLQYTTLAFAWNPGSDSAKDLASISTRSDVFPRTGTSSAFVDYAFMGAFPEGLRGNLSRYLGAAGVTEVVVHMDVAPGASRAAEHLADLDREPGFATTWVSKSFVVYSLEGAVPPFRVVSSVASVRGSHEDLARLLGAGVVDATRQAVYLDEMLPRRPAGVEADLSLVRSAPLEDYLPLGPEGAVVLRPFDASDRHNPLEAWSKAGTWNPLHADWRSTEGRWGERMTMTDLGVGLVVADVPGLALDVPARVQAGREYEVHVRALSHPLGRNVTLAAGDASWTLGLQGDVPRLLTFDLGTWVAPADEATFRLENAAGRNAVSAITLVPVDEADAVRARLRDTLAGERTHAYLHADGWTMEEGWWVARLESPAAPLRALSFLWPAGVDGRLAFDGNALGIRGTDADRWLDFSVGADEPLEVRVHAARPPVLTLAGDPRGPEPPPAKDVPATRLSAARYALDLPPAAPGDVLVTTEFADAQWRLDGASGPHGVALGFQNAIHGLPAEGGARDFRYVGQAWLAAGVAVTLAALLATAAYAWLDGRRRREASAA